MQRHAARVVVIDLEPALLDDAAAACVQHFECLHQTFARLRIAAATFEHLGRLAGIIGQVGDWGVAFLVVVVLRVERNIATRQPGFHLDHLGRLDVEGGGHLRNIGRRQRVAVGVGIAGIALEALLHRPQVEEQLALRFGGGELDHAPIAQDVFVDLGFDPVHRVAHQANTLIRVESLDGLHQPDIAFLDQIAVRQTVAQILA